MSIKTTVLTHGKGGIYTGYAAYEERNGGSLPALLVLQEIWGVDDHIRNLTERFARAGYFAFAPDLYMEHGKRLPQYEARWIEETKSFLNNVAPQVWHDQEKLTQALAPLAPERADGIRATISSLFGGNKPDRYEPQLRESAEFLLDQNELTKGMPLACTGYCMGGTLSALLAGSFPRLSAAVIYYGRPPADEVIRGISCPVLGFYGETDANITPNIPDLAKRMKSAGKSFEAHVYKGAGHAFFNDTRASYHPAAARDAFARTLKFLSERLATNPEVG